MGALLEFLDGEPKVGRALLVEVRMAGSEGLERWGEAMRSAAGFVELARLERVGSEPAAEMTPEEVVAGIYAMLCGEVLAGARSEFRMLMADVMYFTVVQYFGAELAEREMLAARRSLGKEGVP
jgi:hypothetical protein